MFRCWCLSAEVREAGLVGGALVGESGLRVGPFVLEALSGIARRRRDAADGTSWDPALPLLDGRTAE